MTIYELRQCPIDDVPMASCLLCEQGIHVPDHTPWDDASTDDFVPDDKVQD